MTDEPIVNRSILDLASGFEHMVRRTTDDEYIKYKGVDFVLINSDREVVALIDRVYDPDGNDFV